MTKINSYLGHKTGWLILALVVTALTGALSIGESYAFQQPKATSELVISDDQARHSTALFRAAVQHRTAASDFSVFKLAFKSNLVFYNQSIKTKFINYSLSPALFMVAVALPVKTIPQDSDEDPSTLLG